jgi:hypothetical protein
MHSNFNIIYLKMNYLRERLIYKLPGRSKLKQPLIKSTVRPLEQPVINETAPTASFQIPFLNFKIFVLIYSNSSKSQI